MKSPLNCVTTPLSASKLQFPDRMNLFVVLFRTDDALVLVLEDFPPITKISELIFPLAEKVLGALLVDDVAVLEIEEVFSVFF
jgi:hypothetical protein